MHVTAAVITLDLQVEDIDALDAACIDRHALAGIAGAHQGNAACRTEMMAFGDAAPDIGGYAAPFAEQRYLVCGNFPVEEAGAPAGRTIAFDQLGNLFVDFKTNVAAMTG